jgi:hypothetical protein
MTLKGKICLGAGLLSGIITTLTLTTIHHKPAYSCVAGPDEICASDQFVQDWNQFVSIRDKYQIPHDAQVTMTGIVATLKEQVPAGYEWNEKKLRFVKQKPPQAQAQLPSVPTTPPVK